MDFYEKHYSANRMKLVILGREPLDVLEDWAADLFAGVRNKSLQQNRWEDEVPFRPDDLLTQCFAKPVMDLRQLDLWFPFIDEDLLFESQPSRYISHLIGHEGPGSIMSYLNKSKRWATGLRAGMLKFLISQKFPGIWKQKEKWYGTEYTYEKIPADFLAKIQQAAKSTLKNRLAELHLPQKNPFIPTKLEVMKKEIDKPALSPKLIRNNDLFRT